MGTSSLVALAGGWVNETFCKIFLQHIGLALFTIRVGMKQVL